MKLTCSLIIEDRFLKAADDVSSKSLVNVFRSDLNVTCLVVSSTVLVAAVAPVAVGTAVVGAVAECPAVVDAAVILESVTRLAVKHFLKTLK